MKKELKILVLSQILGISEQRVRERSIQEGWPYREVKANGDKRARKYFEIEGLPVDVKTKVLQALASDYQKNVILPQREDLNLSEVQSLIQQWNDAPAWKRREAEARFEILTAFNRFPKNGGRKRAANRFVNEFGVHNSNLGVSVESFKIIKTISRATLYNYGEAYRKYGLVGFLPRGKGKPGGVWTPDMETHMRGLLAKNPDMRGIRVWDYIRNKFAGPGVSLPSKKTVRTKVKKWKDENKSTYAFMRNPDQWRSTYQLALGDASEKAEYYLHFIEFDSTPADVLCRDGKRNVIIGAIDLFSRKAKVLVSPTSKSTAIANLMRLILLDWGHFDFMVVDNGREYISIDVQVACDALRIKLKPTLRFSPELKSFIERFLGSLTVGLFEELRGFVGHNQAQRKAIESRQSFAQRMGKKDQVIEIGLTTPELQNFCDNWIEKIYHQRIHSALAKSPEAKAAESTRPIRRIPDPRMLDILLAPVGYPTVGKKGIQRQGAFYIATELGDYVKRKVEIRLDLSDAGRIYVFEKQSRKFICLAEDASISGLTVAEINEARNAQKKKVREEARALKTLAKQVGDPMTELLQSKRTEPGQVIAFSRFEKVEGGMIEEVGKALKAQEREVEGFRPDSEEPNPMDLTENNSKIIPYPQGRPFFNSCLERYKWLKAQENINFTDRDREFMREYESTLEYYRIFIMPYEAGGAK